MHFSPCAFTSGIGFGLGLAAFVIALRSLRIVNDARSAYEAAQKSYDDVIACLKEFVP